MKLKNSVLFLFFLLLANCVATHNNVQYRKTYEEESKIYIKHFKENFRIGGMQVYSVYETKKEQIEKTMKYEKNFTESNKNSGDKSKSSSFLKKIKSKAMLDDFRFKFVNELLFLNDNKLSLTIDPMKKESVLLFEMPF